MWVENEYTTLVSSSNSTKFHFMSFLWAVLSHLMELHGIVGGMGESFSMETAVGNQLDVIGEWVGLPRILPQTIQTPIYVDGQAYYTNEMTDDEYRFAIKLKVAQNFWGGSNDEANDLYRSITGSEFTFVQTDNMNGTVGIVVYGIENQRIAEIIDVCNLVLIPAGVGRTVTVIETEASAETHSGYGISGIGVKTSVNNI